MDFSNLSSTDSKQLEEYFQNKQAKDFTTLYSGLVNRCFMDCMHDFTSRQISAKEEKCLDKCADKFIKFSERVGIRFGEENQKIQEANNK